MTVEQSPLERFTNQKQQQQPPLLVDDKDSSQSPTVGVIDLTNDGAEKDNDLSKAIALSLKEHERVFGGQVSMEDQDISRVVEASLAESKAVGTKRKRGEAWQDPLNPHDRKRNGDWPVGLKNVGNTCWFSAVIQSLFHLPVFRRLVICYRPPRDWSSIANDTKEKRNLIFMRELRKLFALMLCSKRKYVDPSQALEELKEAFPDSGSDTQQDVSEFSHKLLEYLEEAFKIKSSYTHHFRNQGGDSAMEENEVLPHNPVLDLFYGHFRSEGHNKGRLFSNEETFGQYPLQVNSFSDIHESLEAAMAQEIESYDVVTKSGQESWFTRLPPVLLFELSRFQFNQQLGRPEKIHNKLEFSEIMYMDRYIEQNKNITRSKREKVKRLKEERDKLHRRLERYLNYGHGTRKVPLSTVLEYTLEFMESKKCVDTSSPVPFSPEDVEMASPASVSTSSTGADSPIYSPNNKPNPIEFNNVGPPGSNGTANDLYSDMNEEPTPTPNHMSDMELKVIQTCIKRCQSEVETSVKNLQDNINNIDNSIKEIYSDLSLQQIPYRLHAVLIHEGQAASGHYWAYIYCPDRMLWLKFNDISVSEATWSDLQKDSMGGHHLASAYCVMYVDKKRKELFEENSDLEMVDHDYFTWLPEDLQHYVTDDNNNFELEIEQWDCEQSRKRDNSTMTPNDTDCSIIAEKRMVLEESELLQAPTILAEASSINIGHFHSELAVQHAMLLKAQTVTIVEKASKIISSQGATYALEEILKQESCRLKRLTRIPSSPCDDVRLKHIGAYIIMNSNAPEPFLTWSIYEQFLLSNLDEFHSGSLIREAAIQKIKTLRSSLNSDHLSRYTHWHDLYDLFRKMVGLFVVGLENYYEKCYPPALKLLNCSWALNNTLSTSENCKRGLLKKVVSFFRRVCAVKLNDIIALEFETSDFIKAMSALELAQCYILPIMEYLSAADAGALDNEKAEVIRNRWCSMLGYDIASKQQSPKQERLQDFLPKLLDPTYEATRNGTEDGIKMEGNINKAKLPQVRMLNLEENFQAIISIAIQSGEYDEALL